MQWLSEHWQTILVTALAVDRLLIDFFPQETIFKKIRDVLSGWTTP